MPHFAPKSNQRIRRRKRRVDHAPAPLLPGVTGRHDAAPHHSTTQMQRQEALHDLQARHGNAFVQRLLSRAASESTAANPQIWDSQAAIFYVFPDDQVISLDQVTDPQREWPITVAMADRLHQVDALLAGGATEIEFKGNAAFTVAVMLDLAWLIEQPRGQELLTAVLEAGHKLSFQYVPDGSEPLAINPVDAEARPSGEPGPGSPVALPYAPSGWSPRQGAAAIAQREPAQSLAQQLIVCLSLLRGSAPSTREREPVTAGKHATGEDQLMHLINLENELRDAFGLPQRPSE